METFQKNYWEKNKVLKRKSPDHPIVAECVLPKIEFIKRYVNITAETRLLDVGCGNGFFTYYFDKICDTSGVDYSEKMLQINPVKKTFLMDANNLKFENNSFDISFSHGFLHHVDNMDKVIQEMKRVSKKYVIILDANRNNPLLFLFSLIVKEERKALKFSLSYLRNVIKRNGLNVIDSFSLGMIVPNKMPLFLLPIAKKFNFKQPFGITNFIIAEKT
jgi:ubiquinone/menaquinone biosynthesis C-methylase UbiE